MTTGHLIEANGRLLQRLLELARRDENVRAVLLNGSRANPWAPVDALQDFDAVFVVMTVEPFLAGKAWMALLGRLLISQHTYDPAEGVNRFLMQFADLSRADLTLLTQDGLALAYEEGLVRVLLDKDGLTAGAPEPSQERYLTRRPGKKDYDLTFNEFWWCTTYVARGLWRRELPYAKYIQESVVRPCMIQALAWYAAMGRDWQVNLGKAGRWLQRYLPADLWREVELCYAGSGYEEQWRALERGAGVMGRIGPELAGNLGFAYNIADEQGALEFLAGLKALEAQGAGT